MMGGRLAPNPEGCTCAVPSNTAHVCAERQSHIAWLDDAEIRAAVDRHLDAHPREKAELDMLVVGATAAPTGYPWQTVHHDASVSVDPHPPEPGIVWLQVDVGDRVHIDLELDPDQAAGLLADIQRAIVNARGVTP